jgi:hypothetical protein
MKSLEVDSNRLLINANIQVIQQYQLRSGGHRMLLMVQMFSGLPISDKVCYRDLSGSLWSLSVIGFLMEGDVNSR